MSCVDVVLLATFNHRLKVAIRWILPSLFVMLVIVSDHHYGLIRLVVIAIDHQSALSVLTHVMKVVNFDKIGALDFMADAMDFHLFILLEACMCLKLVKHEFKLLQTGWHGLDRDDVTILEAVNVHEVADCEEPLVSRWCGLCSAHFFNFL